jgi:hypothetical protein
LQLVFKRLYGNSPREQGTLRYFREKLQLRNVTEDVKHYEDCEQLFLSIGRCYTVEALLQFFKMSTPNEIPKENRPPYHSLGMKDIKQQYFDGILDSWLDKYIFCQDINITEPSEEADITLPSREPVTESDSEEHGQDQDYVTNYSLCLLKYFFLIVDFKDAVKEGNGKRLASLHKELLKHLMSKCSSASCRMMSCYQRVKHISAYGLPLPTGKVVVERTLR